MANLANASYVNISGTQLISPSPVALGGIFVNQGSGSIIAYDQGSSVTAGVIVGPMSLAPSTWYPLPFQTSKGLFIAVTACTITVGFS